MTKYINVKNWCEENDVDFNAFLRILRKFKTPLIKVGEKVFCEDLQTRL
jgi:hypothetical protein